MSDDYAQFTDLRLSAHHATARRRDGERVLLEYGEALRTVYDDLLARHRPDSPLATVDRSVEAWTGRRYRLHVYHDTDGWTLALRQLPETVPVLEELGIPREPALSLARGAGLVLFCGPTGAGKSSTLAATARALDEAGLRGDMVTIEEPIEYLWNSPWVSQREVGVDVASFHAGVHEAMRQTPDTVLIGEIRHPRTAEAAVQAGLTGHRVLATLHADDVAEAVSRMWSLLDDQHDEMLAEALQGIWVQHLLRVPGRAPVVVCESLYLDETARSVLSHGPTGLARLAHEQYRQRRMTLRAHAEQLSAQGAVSPAEVGRWL